MGGSNATQASPNCLISICFIRINAIVLIMTIVDIMIKFTSLIPYVSSEN